MVRWGIVGLGRIAGTEIAPAINASKNGVLQAVVSRDQGRADSFAQQHQAARGLTPTERKTLIMLIKQLGRAAAQQLTEEAEA